MSRNENRETKIENSNTITTKYRIMKTTVTTPIVIRLKNNFLQKMGYLLLLFSGMAFGQVVNIPDANFKAKLLAASINNSIATDISGNSIKIDINNDGEIQNSEASAVTKLDVLSSFISDLTGIEAFTNLEFLVCSNQFTPLTITQNSNLLSLNSNINQLTSLNVSQNTNLKYLYCNNNQLSSLNVTQNVNLKDLDCSYNQLITLDLIQNHSLQSLNCSANQLLTKLYIKNGAIETNLTFGDTPNLQYICADEGQIASVQVLAGVNVVVNPYCSFIPGGNHNTISGAIKFDANNNGCDASDLPQPNIRININDGTTQGATFTNNTGNYNFYTPAGSFDLTPDVENPTWFTISPTTATIPFANVNNNSTTQNFCLSANGTHTDVEVVIEPITPARPGFDAVYKIVYKNKGNQMVSGNVSFNYNDAVLDFISATVPPSFQTIGVLNFGFSNLLPFENRSFYITLHVNAPTDTPPVNIGDVLNFTATILNIGDENPLDNTFTYNQTVVGSYDPNNITCLEGASVPTSQIGSFLHYGVNFENTGNYPAENIVVKTIIDTTKYDVNSLQMLNTSNPAYTRITGNVVEFIFNNIDLDSGGHGNVLFKIKTLNSLVNGDMVSREADIFFDYNAPVATGMANTTYQTLNNGQFVLDNSIVVAPNPTSSIVNINGSSAIKSVQVYDIQGRLLETKLLEDVTTTINLSDKTNGIYFFKITTDKGSKVEKIIKE
jgi:uncharacterized repeat protein (TIGR01451 family)